MKYKWEMVDLLFRQRQWRVHVGLEPMTTEAKRVERVRERVERVDRVERVERLLLLVETTKGSGLT